MTDEKAQSEEVRTSLEAEFEKIQTGESTDPVIDRDEKGRFKAKESEEQPAVEETPAEAVEETPAEPITDQGNEPEPEPAEQPLSAPDRWSAEWKTQFATLPRPAQQVLLDRESEYDKGFTQKSQEASELKKRYDPIEQILAPRRQAWAMQGMDDGRALTQLLALSDFAATKPQDFIRWFGQQRGIDLSTLNQPAPQVSPELAPFIQKVTSLEQTIQQQQQAEMDRQINAFKSAPTHEHFEDVRKEMAALMQSGIAVDMEDAYQRACRANPTVFAKVEAAKQADFEAKKKAAEAKRIADAKAAAQKAQKSAGTQLSTKASLNGGMPAPSNMRESLTREYDRIQGAA